MKIICARFSMVNFQWVHIFTRVKNKFSAYKKTTFSLINGLGVTSLRRCFSYSVDNGIARSIDTSSYWL